MVAPLAHTHIHLSVNLRLQIWNIFVDGLVYGLYLTLTTWVLYHVIAKTDWLNHNLGGYSLDDRYYIRRNFCTGVLIPKLVCPNAPHAKKGDGNSIDMEKVLPVMRHEVLEDVL